VLVVEDDPLVREVLAETLRDLLHRFLNSCPI